MLHLLLRREEWPFQGPGGRVQLRPLEKGDIEQIDRWLSDRELVRLAFGTEGEDETLDELARNYCREITSGRKNALAVETPESRFLGFVRFTLRNSRRGRTARVGIMIGDQTHWNRGLGTEAMEALVALLFTRRRVHIIELDTAEFNLRAQRCFEKCGFQRQLRPSQSETDANPKIWMELRKAAWESQTRN